LKCSTDPTGLDTVLQINVLTLSIRFYRSCRIHAKYWRFWSIFLIGDCTWQPWNKQNYIHDRKTYTSSLSSTVEHSFFIAHPAFKVFAKQNKTLKVSSAFKIKFWKEKSHSLK